MAYREPLATTTTPGIITVGSGLSITSSGVLSAAGGAIVAFSENAATPQTTVPSDGTVVVDAMTITPGAGTYQIMFNGNYALLPVSVADVTAQATADTIGLAATLAALPSGTSHGAIFGLGEIITPGVYDVVTAAAIQGILTLDAVGDPAAVFVFRVNGALTSVAASQVLLINGANPANVFWRSAGATALGANTIFAGTAVAVGGAAGIGNASTMIGRLLSTTGAITTDTNTPITVPSGPSPATIPVGVLSTFALFTAAGNVTNTGTSVIVGDIGTDSGAITGYGLPTTVIGNIYTPGSPSAEGPVSADFAVYANGIPVINSARVIFSTTPIVSDVVPLQAVATVAAGQAIDVRSTVISGTLTVNNRILSLVRV